MKKREEKKSQQELSAQETQATLTYLEERRQAEKKKDKYTIAMMKSSLNVNLLKTQLLLKVYKGIMQLQLAFIIFQIGTLDHAKCPVIFALLDARFNTGFIPKVKKVSNLRSFRASV